MPMRFDPVWRRITSDSTTSKLEGQFPARLKRLDGLNNWGALAWLYDHATATKQAHHFGVEWNAVKFIDGDEARLKHHTSFRLAAHVAHWGHLPLSYAGEEALVRAAHVDPAIKSTLTAVLADVIAFGNLTCDDDGHSCAAAVRSGDDPFHLYRWLSAWLVKANWRKLWKATKPTGSSIEDEDRTKRAVIETLVCRNSRGFQVLERCNQADYVPRDLLQAGTAWLTFDIDALWDGNPLGSDSAREWSLIDAAVSYLNERFFHAPDALLAHSLVARVIAGGLLAEGMPKKRLAELTLATDTYWVTRLKPYHRNRLTDLQAEVPGLSTRWALAGQFTDVSLDAGSRLEMEDQLSGVSGKARASYPLTSGVSIYVERGATYSYPPEFVPPGQEFATVTVHQRQEAGVLYPARPMLEVMARISRRIAPTGQLGDNLASWIFGDKVDQRWTAGEQMLGQVACEHVDQFRTSVGKLSARKSLQKIFEIQFMGQLLSFLASPRSPLNEQSDIAASILHYPWPVLRTAPAREILALLRAGALEKASSGNITRRGYALELAVATDQLLAPGNPKERFVLLGSTLLGKDGQPVNEWDVLRLDLDEARGWNLTAIECAITRDAAKDGQARDKLELLQRRLVDRFTDLTSYRTFLGTVLDMQLSYEDAGRSWSSSGP